jgi:lysophospholipase L1-like esterase
VDADVLALAPTLVVIAIGVNDVWHHADSPTTYEQQLVALIRKVTDSGALVVLCTPTVIGEGKASAGTRALDSYAMIVRRVANRFSLPVCDQHLAFQGYISLHNRADFGAGILTKDQVHLNERGNQLFASPRFLRPLESIRF